MRITDIRVAGFGVWKGLKAESIGPDITVFCGQNEAGKTTLMQFVRTTLFGFSEERRERYVPPVYGGLAGGQLDIWSSLGEYEIERHIDPNRMDDQQGDLVVTDTRQGAVHGRDQLIHLLSGIDESIFNNVFAIGLQEIQELGALNSTEAAEHLYRLTSGVDRVSLIDVMHDLEKHREGLWSPDPEHDSRLVELVEQRQKLLAEIDTLRQRGNRWSQIASQSGDLERQLEDLDAQIRKFERESRLIEIALQLEGRWQQQRALTEQIESLGNLPDPRDVSVTELEKLNERMAHQSGRMEQLRRQRRSVKKDAMQLPINRQLWAQKAKIEAIAEHAPWVESLERQASRLKGELQTLQDSMGGEVKGLGNQLKIRVQDVEQLGQRGLSGLKSIAKRLLHERERLKSLQLELDKAGFELAQQEELLGANVSDSESISLEDTSRYVNRLRRRIELEEKIDKLNRSRHELEREIDDVVNDQVLPVGKLAVVGVVFVVGTVMLAFGLIDSLWGGTYFGQMSEQLGILMMMMGTVFGFIAMGLKYHWERVARDELDDFRHQMDILRQQLKRARAERDEIENHLPESIKQFDLELKDAESRLARMEDLIPLEKRVINARAHVEEVRRRIRGQEQEIATAEQEWQAALRTAGLPDQLQPLQLKEISQRSGRISDYHSRLGQLQNELVEREKELESVRQRIDQACHESGIEFEATSTLDRLSQLLQALNEQRSLVAQRREMAIRYRKLRSRQAKAERELDAVRGQKQKLLSLAGCEDETAYRELANKFQQREKLLAQHHNLEQQIEAGLGKSFSRQQLTETFDSFGHSGLEKRALNLAEQLENDRDAHSRMLQQLGELNQEIKVLGEDGRLDEARLELNAVENAMKEVKSEWQVTAATSHLLETIRETYEARRQPETLKEASQYLEQLTEGQYRRIWTRLVGEELLVDNCHDETITVDLLSRGTREAVYLSLRLALVGAYARRGAVVPLVLDDVLVNFDARRAHAAAELLCRFSRNGYQILMFTCHDHMRDLFYKLGASVKVLPFHGDVVESGAVPIDYRGPQTAPPPKPEPIVAVEPEVVEEPEVIEEEPVLVPKAARAELATDEYDPELEYELAAILDDESDIHADRRPIHSEDDEEIGSPVDLLREAC